MDSSTSVQVFPCVRCWRVRDASRGDDATEKDASGPLPRDRVIVPARLLCNTAATPKRCCTFQLTSTRFRSRSRNLPRLSMMSLTPGVAPRDDPHKTRIDACACLTRCARSLSSREDVLISFAASTQFRRLYTVSRSAARKPHF